MCESITETANYRIGARTHEIAEEFGQLIVEGFKWVVDRVSLGACEIWGLVGVHTVLPEEPIDNHDEVIKMRPSNHAGRWVGIIGIAALAHEPFLAS